MKVCHDRAANYTSGNNLLDNRRNISTGTKYLRNPADLHVYLEYIGLLLFLGKSVHRPIWLQNNSGPFVWTGKKCMLQIGHLSFEQTDFGDSELFDDLQEVESTIKRDAFIPVLLSTV